jgi:DNA-binding MarR family transcriptional regulator
VHSAQGGPVVLERREAILRRLVGVIDEGRTECARGTGCTPLTAEGLVGAGVAIVSARLLNGERGMLKGKRGQLRGLLGELMGMIVLPYEGPAAARREQARSVPNPLPRIARDPGESRSAAGGDPLEGVQMRLTYRTARVLEGIARHPGGSNRVVADQAEIQDQGQVSKLLARLERLGLLQNTSDGHSKGEPNAWALTSKGERVARSFRLHANSEREAA